MSKVLTCFTTHVWSHFSLTVRKYALSFSGLTLAGKTKERPVITADRTDMIQFTWHCPQSHKQTQWAHTKHDHGHNRGDQGKTENTTKDRRVCACVKSEGLNRGSFLQEQETIKDFLFTSQSTQTQVEPTAEEQSEEEIKKEVRQHKVNTQPRRLIIPLAPGLTMPCGKCPHSLMPSQCPRCTDLWRTQPLSNKHCSVSRSPTSGMRAASKETPFFSVYVLIYIKVLSAVSLLDWEEQTRISAKRKCVHTWIRLLNFYSSRGKLNSVPAQI